MKDNGKNSRKYEKRIEKRRNTGMISRCGAEAEYGI